MRKAGKPARGLENLLADVCRRLRGTGGEIGSIFRLDTAYGGKTHGLIAPMQPARGVSNVSGIEAFIDPSLLPSERLDHGRHVFRSRPGSRRRLLAGRHASIREAPASGCQQQPIRKRFHRRPSRADLRDPVTPPRRNCFEP